MLGKSIGRKEVEMVQRFLHRRLEAVQPEVRRVTQRYLEAVTAAVMVQSVLLALLDQCTQAEGQCDP